MYTTISLRIIDCWYKEILNGVRFALLWKRVVRVEWTHNYDKPFNWPLWVPTITFMVVTTRTQSLTQHCAHVWILRKTSFRRPILACFPCASCVLLRKQAKAQRRPATRQPHPSFGLWWSALVSKVCLSYPSTHHSLFAYLCLSSRSDGRYKFRNYTNGG